MFKNVKKDIGWPGRFFLLSSRYEVERRKMILAFPPEAVVYGGRDAK